MRIFTRECELSAYIGVLWESKPERTNMIKSESSHFLYNNKNNMKLKNIFLAALCLISLTIVSCSINEPDNKKNSALAGTTWKGSALQTKVVVSFAKEECTILLSGYVNGTGIASYEATQSTFTATIKNTQGSSDGQLNVGDVVTGTYSIEDDTMDIDIVLYGEKSTIHLSQNENVPEPNKPEPVVPDNNEPTH